MKSTAVRLVHHITSHPAAPCVRTCRASCCGCGKPTKILRIFLLHLLNIPIPQLVPSSCKAACHPQHPTGGCTCMLYQQVRLLQVLCPSVCTATLAKSLYSTTPQHRVRTASSQPSSPPPKLRTCSRRPCPTASRPLWLTSNAVAGLLAK